MVDVCVSAAAVSARAAQLLDGFVSGGIIPVQVTLTVWPMVEGTVMLLVGGVDAKLSKASTAPLMQRSVASVIRAAIEKEFIFMGLISICFRVAEIPFGNRSRSKKRMYRCIVSLDFRASKETTTVQRIDMPRLESRHSLDSLSQSFGIISGCASLRRPPHRRRFG